MFDLGVDMKEEFSFARDSSFGNVSFSESFGIIHLERSQNFQKTNFSYTLIRAHKCAF